MVLDREFLDPQISRHRGTRGCRIGLFRYGVKQALRDYKDPCFSFLHFLFYLRKWEWKEGDSCDFLRENESSSGDYDSSSGDDDSSSDDLSSGGVLI